MTKAERAHAEVDLGRLYWGQLRDYLKRMQFIGRDVEWIESSGWFSRRFTIRGERAVISDIRIWIGILEQSG